MIVLLCGEYLPMMTKCVHEDTDDDNESFGYNRLLPMAIIVVDLQDSTSLDEGTLWHFSLFLEDLCCVGSGALGGHSAESQHLSGLRHAPGGGAKALSRAGAADVRAAAALWC